LNCSEFRDGRTDWEDKIRTLQRREGSSKEDGSKYKSVGKMRKKENKKGRRKEGKIKEAGKHSYQLHYFRQLCVTWIRVGKLILYWSTPTLVLLLGK
jgi:hypothetical protein